MLDSKHCCHLKQRWGAGGRQKSRSWRRGRRWKGLLLRRTRGSFYWGYERAREKLASECETVEEVGETVDWVVKIIL